ncbi:MAG: hypothetical protein U0K13_04055 [Oscillospiraceae bacterium]|nr:hypothetical protein [Oscillospiraceae bacterium]
MKNWKKAGIAALCVAALLAGCGMQGGDTNNNDKNADEPKEISLEQVRADNIPEKLLADHDTVTVNIQGTDRDGEVTYTARLQYTDGGDGTILMSSHYNYTANSGPGEEELWSEGRGRLYATRMTSDDNASLNIYPIPGEGTEYLREMLPQCTDPAAKNAEETLDERSEQDGAVLLSTTTRFKDAGGYYYTTLYYADPETGELLAMSVTDYIEDGEGGATEMGTTLYNWSYDEPYKTEPYKSGRYLLNDVVYATDDTRPACLLTVCLPAEEGGEDWWVNEYHVARGTYVNICCRSGCTLYADAALTKPIDDTVSIDTNGEEMTVYVVPDAPMN